MRHLVWFFLYFSFSSIAWAENYPPVSVKLTPVKVGEHSWYVPGQAGMATEHEGFISNAGFVVTPEGVLVFDALGSPSLAWAFRQAIKSVTPLPVKKVVVSHYHADHIYGLQVFKEEGAEIIAPIEAVEYLAAPGSASLLEQRRFELSPWVNDETNLVRPDVLIDKNTEFTFGGLTFQLTHLGAAHSDGDMSMYVVQDGVLYSGDIIFEGRVPYVGDADSLKWLDALKTMEKEGLVALVPGHGPAAKKPLEAIHQTLSYIAYLRQTMGAAVENFIEFAEAYESTDWSAWENMPAFDAANRVNANKIYLTLEQEALSGN